MEANPGAGCRCAVHGRAVFETGESVEDSGPGEGCRQSNVFTSPPEYAGIGRPQVRGKKIRLNDDRTLPPGDVSEEWQSGQNTRIEVRRRDNVRTRQWPNKPLSLYRVIDTRLMDRHGSGVRCG